MPDTIIFVHGVNSEGEWYEEAAKQFAAGLNKRLGRTDLESAKFNHKTMRFTGKNQENQRARSPIIPFLPGRTRAILAQVHTMSACLES